ncbi:MAG: TRAP transporter large permease subunit [Dehalococcoidia bacterium]
MKPFVPLLKRIDALDVVIAVSLAVWMVVQVTQHWVYIAERPLVNAHITLAGAMVAARFIQLRHGLPRWAIGAPALGISLYAAVYFSSLGGLVGADLVRSQVPDMVLGGLLFTVATVMVWQAFGITFALLGPVFVLYMFFGRFAPDPFTVPSYDIERIFRRLTLGAMYGKLSYDVANYLWLLIFWGMLIEVSGAGRFIRLIAHLLSRRFATGPALAAVMSSALVGSFTGTGSANVMVTGSVTIPMMRRAGYKPHQAAAIESAASTAAGITPPVMGIVPFIMAGTLGVPYLTIMKMVFLIAIIWYVSVIIYVIASGARLNLRRATRDEEGPLISLGEAVRSALLMIVPVGALILFIVRDWPLLTAVLYAMAVLVVLSVVLRVERSPSVWWQGIRRAAVTAASFSMAILIVQLITDVMFFSTLIIRVGHIVDIFSGGDLIVAGLIVLFFGVLISGPLPPLAVYFVMVITFQPVFFELGLPQSITVFTAFYMGILGAITPPMAPSPMVAAGIAQARFLETSIETMKVASAAFFIPFLILLAPELLLSAPGVEPSTPGHVLLVFSTVVISLAALSFGLVGWLAAPLRMPVRLAFSSMAFVMVAGVHQDSDALLWTSLAGSVALMATAVSSQVRVSRRGRRSEAQFL